VKYLLHKVKNVQRVSSERTIQTENSLALIEAKMNPFQKWCLSVCVARRHSVLLGQGQEIIANVQDEKA